MKAIVEAGTGYHTDQYRVLVHERQGPYGQLAWWPVSHHATLAEAQAHRDRLTA